MTLKDLINKMERVAASQPAINMIVRQDVFRINDCTSKRYGIFSWVQQRHRTSVNSSLIDFTFILYYVDRLTEDFHNMTDVHSTGISTLDNIIRQMNEEGVFVQEGYSFLVARQKFLDECGVVYAEVTFSVKKDDLCAEDGAAISDESNVIIY